MKIIKKIFKRIKSTFKFAFWFIGFLFTREGIKQTVWVLGLGVAVGFLLVRFELQAWSASVNFTTQLFNKPVEDVSLNIPHAQETVDNLLKWNFGSEASLAKAIFRAESGLRCGAEGDGHLTYQKNGITYGASYGIAQIRYLPGRPSPAQLKDCKFAIQYAKQLRDAHGNFSAWSAYNNGSYKKYLN